MGGLLHGVLVLLVATDVFAGLLALLAPLALLVFVPPVAVALLTVMPPPAAAANGRGRGENARKGQRRGRRREIGRDETKEVKREERKMERDKRINVLITKTEKVKFGEDLLSGCKSPRLI